VIASPRNPVPQVALRDNHAAVDQRQIWQLFIANYAVNRVLRLQHAQRTSKNRRLPCSLMSAERGGRRQKTSKKL
jgi:hypothetical protein